MYPIAYPLSWILDKLLGEEIQTIWSKREIKEIIKHHENNENSDIDKDEERILIGALSFSEVSVKKVMTPKPVLYTLEKSTILTQEKLLEIRDKGFTRIPVYSGVEDKLIGILYSKDLIGIVDKNKTVEDFLSKSKPITIKDTMLLDGLMNHFITQKVHIAFVYDLYSTFIGIVTLEDVIEEILKVEIIDEVDVVADMQHLAMEQSIKNLLDQ